jgi:cytochrome oxidase assembly protein ShyY1
MSGFRPGLLPSLVVLLLLPLLLWLGFWQLERADEKRALLAAFEARRSADPMPVSALELAAEPAYTRVVLQGSFDAEHSLLLDNRTRAGVAGVELLQPFYDQPSGLWLLVNRGWLPWPDRRTPPQFTTPENTLKLSGWVYLQPGEGFLLKQTESSGWPKLVNSVDAPALWQVLGRGGAPFQVRLDPGTAAYQVDWPIVAMDPQKHMGYAVQWFAMALALLLLFIYLGIRNARDVDDEFSTEPE